MKINKFCQNWPEKSTWFVKERQGKLGSYEVMKLGGSEAGRVSS